MRNSTKAVALGIEKLGWIWEQFLKWKILIPGGKGEGGAEISNLDSWVSSDQEAGIDNILSLTAMVPGEMSSR